MSMPVNDEPADAPAPEAVRRPARDVAADSVAESSQLSSEDVASRKAVLKLQMQAWVRDYEKQHGRPPNQADKQRDATYMKLRRELKTVDAALQLARELLNEEHRPSALAALVRQATHGSELAKLSRI